MSRNGSEFNPEISPAARRNICRRAATDPAMPDQLAGYSASISLSEEEVARCRKTLQGFVDLHIHLAPDVAKRACDDHEFANDAERIGYGGFVLKDHYSSTAARAYDLRKLHPKLAIRGGLTLNHAVGGFNPDAVEAAIMLGAAQIWMPTFGAQNHYNHFGVYGLPGLVPVKQVRTARNPTEKLGLTILNSGSGGVKREVEEILSLVADSNVILGTGHLDISEIYVLLDAAKRAGVKKFLVTHPEFIATNWSAEDQKKLAERGAILEHCANMNFEPKLWAKNIKSVGADRCVLSSDSGQLKKGHPAVAMSDFLEALAAEGITESEIETMSRQNPMKLLDLD